MADALLDKSLDALISERSSKRPPSLTGGSKRGGRTAGGRGGAKAGRGSGARPASQPADEAPRVITALKVQGRKIVKPVAGTRVGRGAARAAARPGRSAMYMQPVAIPPGYVPAPAGWIPMPAGTTQPVLVPQGMVPAGIASRAPSSKPYTPRDPDADMKWVNDLFDGAPPKRSRGRLEQRLAPATTIGTKLVVHNLHDAVSEEDLKELFGDKGELLSVKMRYDHSGRSTGEATVVFKRREDALAAVQLYHGAKLDGQELRIELEENRVVMCLKSGIKVTGAGEDAPRPAVRGVGRMLQQALPSATGMGLPRGMGDPAPASRPRGAGPGPRTTIRLRSGVRAAEDDMQE